MALDELERKSLDEAYRLYARLTVGDLSQRYDWRRTQPLSDKAILRWMRRRDAISARHRRLPAVPQGMQFRPVGSVRPDNRRRYKLRGS